MRLIIFTTLPFFFLCTYAGAPFNPSFIKVQQDSTLCLAAASNTNGAPVWSTDCDFTDPSQVWTSNGATTSVFGGTMCLDVTNGINADGTPLQIWQCTPGDVNQQISLVGDTFAWTNTNKCMDLTNGALCSDNQVQMFTCNGGFNQNQEWIVVPTNTYTISPQEDSSLCLTGGASDGVQISLQPCGSNPALQQWHNQTNRYSLSNNECLDDPNGSTTNGQILQVWTCTTGDANQVFPTTNDGRITFQHQCADVTNGLFQAGNLIQLFLCTTGDNNQAWLFNQI